MGRHSLTFLSRDPWIGVTSMATAPDDAARHLAREAQGAPAHLLMQNSWDGRVQLQKVGEFAQQVIAKAPNLRVVAATSTNDETDLYSQAGIPALWFNHNAALDERRFQPGEPGERIYDAVYVARLVPFKRHELATKVPRMAVVTGAPAVEASYAQQCIDAYEDLRFVNFRPKVGVERLSVADVARVLRQSWCGLALSETEGAMYAAGEYLLCGLPVVTTASSGGRDEFFHPDYVETVEADPVAVAEAVAGLIGRGLDPMMIRKRTLAAFRPHRARLLAWMSEIIGEDQSALASKTLWHPAFAHKLATWWNE